MTLLLPESKSPSRGRAVAAVNGGAEGHVNCGGKRRMRIHSIAAAFVLLAVAACLSRPGLVSAGKDAGGIEHAQAALEKWIEIQGVISREKHDLVLAREMLNERIELVKREIQTLQGKIGEAEESIAEADKKRAEMTEENEKLKKASGSLGRIIEVLERRMIELLGRLPDPIRQRVKPLSQSLPQARRETELSVAERFQNIVGILNELDKFNREISMTSEVRTLNDGSSVEVTALYIGIGRGYYAGADGGIAGIGMPSDEGWTWRQENEFAGRITDAIAILKNEKVACFVQLPVVIE